MSCSRTQHSDSNGDESHTSNPSIPSLTLYQLSHFALPKLTMTPPNALHKYKISSLRDIYMGESSKFQKSRTFEIQILKLAVCLQSVNSFKFKWSITQRWNENKSEAIKICLVQHFEADFLWKVSLKILNSVIILKTFTHVSKIAQCTKLGRYTKAKIYST